MASLAGVTLVWRGTTLDRIWELNPRAYRELAPLGKTPGILFLLLACILATAAVGWFRRRPLGWKLAVAIIVTQILGDFLNILRGHVVEGAVGVTIAGVFLYYLTRSKVRALFRN